MEAFKYTCLHLCFCIFFTLSITISILIFKVFNKWTHKQTNKQTNEWMDKQKTNKLEDILCTFTDTSLFVFNGPVWMCSSSFSISFLMSSRSSLKILKKKIMNHKSKKIDCDLAIFIYVSVHLNSLWVNLKFWPYQSPGRKR